MPHINDDRDKSPVIRVYGTLIEVTLPFRFIVLGSSVDWLPIVINRGLVRCSLLIAGIVPVLL